MKRILALAVPGALAGGAIQINTLISQLLSGSDEGARSVLYYAERLYMLPLGLIGVAVGLALVPRLTRHFAEDNRAGADRTMDEGLGLSMAFTLPAALALLIMPFFIIDGIVTRGEFTTEDAHRTAEVLRHFAWGVPAFVLAKVFTPPYFARHRAKQPMQFSIAAVVINTVMGAALWFWLPTVGVDGAIGLAIATSTASWINVALLAGTLARQKIYRMGPAFLGRMVRLVGASAVMGAFIAVCAWQYPLLADLFWRKEVAVLLVAAAGFGIYAASAIALGAVTPAEIRSSLRREKGPAGIAQGLPGGSEG